MTAGPKPFVAEIAGRLVPGKRARSRVRGWAQRDLARGPKAGMSPASIVRRQSNHPGVEVITADLEEHEYAIAELRGT